MTSRDAWHPDPGLGLVLGSGAARGAAHAGVLLALAEAGVRPGVVVGTSAGALVGGVWAAGTSAEVVVEQVLTATWEDFGRPRPGRAGLALIETAALRSRLASVFGGRRIEELPVRFGAVATDIVTRRAILLDRGDPARAIQASLAVPGVFPPVRVGTGVMVDGVLTSPVPVWAAHRLGARRTIAVRLRTETPSGPGQNLWRAVVPQADDVQADLELVIDTAGYSSWSTRDVPYLVDLGYQATRDALRDAVDLGDSALPAGGDVRGGIVEVHRAIA